MRRDFSTPTPPKAKYNWLKIIGAVLLLAVGIFLLNRAIVFVQTIVQPKISEQKPLQAPFPTISTKNLTATQQRVLALLKQEYDKMPRHYDKTVLKYTEGIRESWCADFISWVFLKAGAPLTNPNSDYWRIPGVLTLQKYYRDTGNYIEANAGYIPKLGDIAFYIGAQTPDNSSEEHAAFVLKVEGDTITTIGGNEGNGIMRIRTESLKTNSEKGLVGFGKLAS